MKENKVRSFLLYCGIKKEEYNEIHSLIWERNRYILGITSALASGMGLLFLILTRFLNSSVWFPYLFLAIGSFIIFLIVKLTHKKALKPELVMFLCYIQMVLFCVYAGILSVQESNYAIPATSIVVFIAILPFTIDDRPLRMYCFMIVESSLYLVTSYFFKDPKIFSLDLMNVITFCFVGMGIYSVICARNIREIFQGKKVDRLQKSIISSLATVVEERDESTGGHIARTENYVLLLTEKMKRLDNYNKYDDTFFRNVRLASAMHDIGKIKIPDVILNKPGKLTEEEFKVMKKHANYGADIIEKTMNNVENPDYYQVAYNIAKYHHERYDGNGYPEGLAKEDIPLEARIMALADVYDALVSERVYKKPYPKEEAKKIIEAGIGTQFDPILGKLFLECIEQI